MKIKPLLAAIAAKRLVIISSLVKAAKALMSVGSIFHKRLKNRFHFLT